MRQILPILLGASLGALVVVVLLGGEAADDPPAALTAAAERAAPSTTDSPAAADAGDSSPVVTLDELASLTRPAARQQAALALLETLGRDAAAIEQVAASLPPVEAVNFRIHAIVSLAESDPPGALAAAMSLPDQEQRRLALRRLAPVLAGADPAAARAAIDQIDSPDLESEFVTALLDAWALNDPESVFGYLASADALRLPAGELPLATLAAIDPERLLGMADDLRRDIAMPARTAALESLVQRDAAAALAHIDALPAGSDKSRLRHTAAQVYGEQNPAAAWEWATSAKVDALARIGVVRGIQQVDPDRAWAIMQSQLNSTDARVRAGTQEYLMNYVNAIVSSASPDDIVTGLDRLFSLNDPRVDAAMQTNIQAWADRDPEGALDWSLRNLDRINVDNVLTSLSSGLARTNLDLARQTTFRLDEAERTAWAAGVGRALAEQDPAAARSWAYELPSGPLRDAGLTEVIRSEAHGGTVDRQLFGQFSSDRARAEAASAAIRRFACDGRTELAQAIATEYITEQRLLEQAERDIQGGSNGSYFPGSFLCQFTL